MRRRLAFLVAVLALALPGVAAVWTSKDVSDIPPIDFRLSLIEGLADAVHHSPVEAGAGLVYAGGVDENNLPGRQREDALNSGARGLRLVGHDGDLGPDQRVHERRFAYVGAPQDGDEA